MSSSEPAATPKAENQREQNSLKQNETSDDGGSSWSISSWLNQAKDKVLKRKFSSYALNQIIKMLCFRHGTQ